jgi:hypothetical protein
MENSGKRVNLPPTCFEKFIDSVVGRKNLIRTSIQFSFGFCPLENLGIKMVLVVNLWLKPLKSREQISVADRGGDNHFSPETLHTNKPPRQEEPEEAAALAIIATPKILLQIITHDLYQELITHAKRAQ